MDPVGKQGFQVEENLLSSGKGIQTCPTRRSWSCPVKMKQTVFTVRSVFTQVRDAPCVIGGSEHARPVTASPGADDII
ncbi:hypothetical protein E2C01_060788 [Portunus trituberculatus]|uniref:Uncharacterized protein n=1 Tax=Portunus trituberculatus TaxID=210409 RepID=A0A5B7HBJ1_PORTR|nr:hypothetical protein [Portunus trituberculatus]